MYDFKLQLPSPIKWSHMETFIDTLVLQGIPRAIVDDKLLEYIVDNALSKITLEELEILREKERLLVGVMLDRNLRGRELEKQGEVDEAIHLYEENVSDWFYGSFPYERLRVIYTKRRMYKDAERVCMAYVKVSDYRTNYLRNRSRDPRLDWEDQKRDKFLAHANKLQSMSAKITNQR